MNEHPDTIAHGARTRLQTWTHAALSATATAIRWLRAHADGPVFRRLRTQAGHPVARRVGLWAALLSVTTIGVLVGVLVGGHVTSDIGPFQARFAVTPSVSGGTDVKLPPLGSLEVQSHDGPAHLSIDLATLDASRTQKLIAEPNGIERASAGAPSDIGHGLVRLILQVAGVAILGAMALAALAFRSMRRAAVCGLLALGMVVASIGIGALTFRRGALAEPRYEGLLTNARSVVGDAQQIASRYDQYTAQLQRMVTNVSRLYATLTTLPVYEPPDGTIRVLHISDMHLNPGAWSVVQTVVEQFHIDMVVDTGDITDWGSEPEESYVASIAALRVPYIYIRGNHDSDRTAAAVGRQPNATVLDNSVTTVDGLTIAGIGDPRFTPDKSAEPTDPAAASQVQDQLELSGSRLANTISMNPSPVDIALVHDPASAGPLAGVVPLVLAGHLHHREIDDLTVPPGSAVPHTTLMVEGSTGGAGLRGLENTKPVPLDMSVLYFNPQHVLQAYDQVTVGGTGQTEVTVQRHVAEPATLPENAAATPPAATSSTPTTSTPTTSTPTTSTPTTGSTPTPARSGTLTPSAR